MAGAGGVSTIEVTDPAASPPMTGAELLEAVGHLLALIDGLPTGVHLCGTCGSPHRLSLAHDLEATARDIKRELYRRGAKMPAEIVSDWLARVQKLEVD